MSEARADWTELKTDPELLALLEKARSHVMTPEERRHQRRSWVIGEMMLEHPDMTREQAEKLADSVLGPASPTPAHEGTER